MTVSNLIEHLKKCDPDKEVFVVTGTDLSDKHELCAVDEVGYSSYTRCGVYLEAE